MSLIQKSLIFLSAVTLLVNITGCVKVKITASGQPTAAAITPMQPIADEMTPSGSAGVSSIRPVPGFGFHSGGGTAFGNGIQATTTIGEITGTAIQSGAGMTVVSGVQGSTF